MAALQFTMLPNYRALIVRKTYKQLSLPGALMERAAVWLAGTDAKWDGYTKTWTFKSGAKLTFGHVEHENDALNYQSSSFHFIGIDEVTDLKESTYLFLMSRCRRTKGDDYIPLRFRSASNPTGAGKGWAKKRFVIPVSDRKKASIFKVKNQDGEWETRFFIPANLRDNPYLDINEYKKALSKLDPVMRARLLEGDWDAQQSGSVFDTAYLEFVTRDTVPMRIRKIRYWDLAGTDTVDNPNASNTVGILYGVDRATGFDYVLDMVKAQRNPTDVEQLLISQAHKDGRDVEVWIEQEPGQSGKAQIHRFQEMLRGYIVKGDLPGKRGSKEVRAKPVANKIGRRRVRVVEGKWNEEFLLDLEAFPKEGQDTVDALSGAHSAFEKAPAIRKTNRMRPGAGRKPRMTIFGEQVG